MKRILQDMIAVLDSIDTYNSKVREWQRHTQGEAPISRPAHLRLDLPGGQPADAAFEAGVEALEATGQRALTTVHSSRKMPRII